MNDIRSQKPGGSNRGARLFIGTLLIVLVFFWWLVIYSGGVAGHQG